jgi:phage FluMu protein Com
MAQPAVVTNPVFHGSDTIGKQLRCPYCDNPIIRSPGHFLGVWCPPCRTRWTESAFASRHDERARA